MVRLRREVGRAHSTAEAGESWWREVDELAEELRNKRYSPSPVKRQWIEKSSGGKRPLGIPTIRDRVAQTAAVLVLQPIFDADFHPQQHGYRPDHSPEDAVQEVHRLLTNGYTEVVDADLSGYFDSIPHEQLMKSVARGVSDGSVLELIEMWLEMPVEETDEDGNTHRSTRARDERRGTPQGASISPLLANIYMRRFMVAWEEMGVADALEAYIVNFADDFVICCRDAAEEAMEAIKALFRDISEQTSAKHTTMERTEMVRKLNAKLRGWANYFSLGPVYKAYRKIDAHVRERLRQWLGRKHQQHGRAPCTWTDDMLYGTLGLIRLTDIRRNFS